MILTGDCSPGYYCTGGAYGAEPNDNYNGTNCPSTTGSICPVHNYCPAASNVPKLCNIGYYANTTGMSECVLCLAKYTCYPGQFPVICPEGKLSAFIHVFKEELTKTNKFLKFLMFMKVVSFLSYIRTIIIIVYSCFFPRNLQKMVDKFSIFF